MFSALFILLDRIQAAYDFDAPAPRPSVRFTGCLRCGEGRYNCACPRLDPALHREPLMAEIDRPEEWGQTD